MVAESLNESESIYFSELLIHTDFIYWSAYSSLIQAAVESSIELLSTTVGNKPEPLEEIRQKSRAEGKSIKSISKSK